MAEAAVSANRLELLQIADAVAREKSIEKSVVIAAMEDAIQRAARSRSASRTFCTITCLAFCAAMRPNSIGGKGSAMASPILCRRSSSAASPPPMPSR